MKIKTYQCYTHHCTKIHINGEWQCIVCFYKEKQTHERFITHSCVIRSPSQSPQEKKLRKLLYYLKSKIRSTKGENLREFYKMQLSHKCWELEQYYLHRSRWLDV